MEYYKTSIWKRNGNNSCRIIRNIHYKQYIISNLYSKFLNRNSMAKQSTTTRPRSSHTCSQAEAIKIIQEQINGNGKKGIREVVNTLSGQMETVIKDLDPIKADLKVLVQFQTQIETKEEERDKHKNEIIEFKKSSEKKSRWLIGLIISTTLTLMGLIITIITLIDKIEQT